MFDDEAGLVDGNENCCRREKRVWWYVVRDMVASEFIMLAR